MKKRLALQWLILMLFLIGAQVFGESCGPFFTGPNTCTTVNMGLPLPIVGLESGPSYGYDLNSSLSLIDSHNHTPGYGVQVPTAGININTALTFNNQRATDLQACIFDVQSAVSTPFAIYMKGVDFYVNDGNGNVIQITQSGSIAGTPGSISNLTPPASASYVAGTSTFVWQSASNTAANMDMGSITLRDILANSHGVTINPPASLSSNYSLNLPASLPGVKSVMALDASGNITAPYTVDNSTISLSGNIFHVPTGGIGTTQLASGAVTSAKLDTNIAVNGTITVGAASTGVTLQGNGNTGVSGWLTSTMPFSIGQGNAWLTGTNSRTMSIVNNGNSSSYGINTSPYTTYAQVTIAGTLALVYSSGALSSASITAGTTGFHLGTITGSIYQIVLYDNAFASTPPTTWTCESGGGQYESVTTNGFAGGVLGAGTSTVNCHFMAIGERGI